MDKQKVACKSSNTTEEKRGERNRADEKQCGTNDHDLPTLQNEGTAQKNRVEKRYEKTVRNG